MVMKQSSFETNLTEQWILNYDLLITKSQSFLPSSIHKLTLMNFLKI